MQVDKVVFSLQEGILKKLPEPIQDKVCIAGGAVRDLLLGEELKDYDIFVQDLETEKILMNFLDSNAKKGHINDRLANYTYEGRWLQVIRNRYWNMKDSSVINDFDFVHCCAMVTMEGIKTHPNFFQAIATKHIQVNKLLFPLSSFERMQKYIQKGYVACNGTLLTIAKSLKNVDFDNTDENTLESYPGGTPRFVGID